MKKHTPCPLCDYPRAKHSSVHEPGRLARRVAYKCARCGRFEIDFELRWAFEALSGRGGPPEAPGPQFRALYENRHLISGRVRQVTIEGHGPVLLTAESAKTIITGAPRNVLERLDRFLLNLGAATGEEGGEWFRGKAELNYPLGYCRGPDERDFFLYHLRKAGFAEIAGEEDDWIRLTVAGWERVRELKETAEGSVQAFVAMSFGPEFDSLFDDVIVPAVSEAGYQPFRVDREEHVDRIDDKIIVEINRSRFLIAEMTGHNPGVYFEAGYALGRRLPVVWTCRKDEFDEAHFDTEHYNYIVWEDDEQDLGKRLTVRIKAVVG